MKRLNLLQAASPSLMRKMYRFLLLAARKAGQQLPQPRLILCLLLIGLMGSSSSSPARAFQADASSTHSINREYTIKAAFLYHFLSYVDWPDGTFANKQEPFVIGVFGQDPFGTVLDKIAKAKKVDGRPIEIQRISQASKLNACHIIFVPSSVNSDEQEALLKSLIGTHVLCVGESSDFVERGGSAQFFLEGNKVRFFFNVEVAKRKTLKISSKLLSLAKKPS